MWILHGMGERKFDQTVKHKWVHKTLWVPKMKVIHCPWSKSHRFNTFKLLFLNNHSADWSQILCGVALGWGNESLFKLFRSHDQDGHHAHIVKFFKNLLWNLKADDLETWYAASHTRVLSSLFKWCPRVDLDLYYGKIKFGAVCFCTGKS